MGMCIVPGLDLLTEFCKAAGVDALVRRVIIDIPIDGAVMVYYETFADKSKFKIDMTALLRHAQVVSVDKAEADHR